jgi:anti-sigma factor RsiW
MKHLLCASVNRVLEAYHDGELPVEEQIVVETHLSECYLCASPMAMRGRAASWASRVSPGRRR